MLRIGRAVLLGQQRVGIGLCKRDVQFFQHGRAAGVCAHVGGDLVGFGALFARDLLFEKIQPGRCHIGAEVVEGDPLKNLAHARSGDVAVAVVHGVLALQRGVGRGLGADGELLANHGLAGDGLAHLAVA